MLILKFSWFLGYICFWFVHIFSQSFFFFEKSVKNYGTKIIYTFQFVISCSRQFVIMFCVTASLALLLVCFYFFPKTRTFVLIKLFFFKNKNKKSGFNVVVFINWTFSSEAYLEPSRWLPFKYFSKKLYYRCLTGF